MRVLIVGPHRRKDCPTSGGVSRVVEILAGEIGKYHEVHVLVPNANTEGLEHFGDYEVTFLRACHLPGILRYWSLDALRVSNAVRRLSPTVTHFQGAAGWSLLSGGPKIFTFHGSLGRDFLLSDRAHNLPKSMRASVAKLFDFFEGIASRKMDHHIIISEYVYTLANIENSKKTRLIPNPIHPDFFSTRNVENVDRVPDNEIIFVGRISPRKRILEIIELVASYRDKYGPIRLRICGEIESDRYFEICNKLISDLSLDENIEFLGSLNTSELIREIDRSNLLLLLSSQETAPLVISEAHSRGIPVCTTKDFGIPWMITEWVDGCFLPKEGRSKQAEQLNKAIKHPWENKRIRYNSRIKYKPNLIARQTMAVYEDVHNNAAS